MVGDTAELDSGTRRAVEERIRLLRKRGYFRSLQFVVKRVPALMMFGLEFAFDAHLASGVQCGMSPYENVEGASFPAL